MPSPPKALDPRPVDPRLRAWRLRIFASTWLCYAGFYFCRKPFYVAKGGLAEEHSLDASTLGLIGAVYLVAYAIGQFVAGVAGQRLGPRVLLLLGMAVSIGASVVFGAGNSPAVFVAFMALNGLAQATGWSGTVGTMASWFHRGERGTVMGLWATNFQVGGVLATWLASFALDAWGWRYSFFAGSLVLLAVWTFFVFFQRDRPEDVGLPPVEDPADVAGSKDAGSSSAVEPGRTWPKGALANVLLVGAFYFFVKFVRYALWSWAPFFLERHFGLRGDEAGYLSTLFDLFGIAGVVVTGFLSDRFFGSRRAGVGLAMMLGMTGACVLLVAAGGTSIVVFAVCLALVGFTLYGPDALLTGAGAMDIGSRRGATLAAGIINGMGSLGSVVQELAIGRMIDAGDGLGPILFLLLFASAAAAAVLAVVVVRNKTGRSYV